MDIEENEKDLYKAFENIFIDDSIFLNNISKFEVLMKVLSSELSKYDFNISSDCVIGKSKIYSIEERFNFVKEFYKKHNINFDIDKLINDGIIEFYNKDGLNQYQDEVEKCSIYSPDMGGEQKFIDDMNLLFIHNTGYLFDSIVLCHEISHYRNQFKPFNDISDLFTEVLAFVESDIMAKEILTNEEYEFYIKKQLYGFKLFSTNNHVFFEFANLFDKLGKINYKNYCLLYGDISEDLYKNKINSIFEIKEFDISNSSRYTIAGLLVPYMLNKYYEDNNYFETIEQLHDIINSSDINTILTKIGFSIKNNNFFNRKNINILVNNLHDFINKNIEKRVTK